YVAHVTHVDQSGNPTNYTLPFPLTEGWCVASGCNIVNSGTLVLGDNNTAFASNGREVIAFDVNSGTSRWAWQPQQFDPVPLVAASTGGGVVAKDITYDSNNNPTEHIVSLDASGNPTYDNSFGPGSSGLDYWTLGEYLTAGPGAQKVMTTAPFQVALTSAPHPRGGSRQHNGAAKRLE